MESFLTGIPNLRISETIRDDDSVDQLHHYVTVYMFVLFGLIIGVKELYGQPLDCWTAQEKFKHYQEHVNSYCWANKLYNFPDPENFSVVPYALTPAGDVQNITLARVKEETEGLNIYRWVTIVFIIQAFLFKLPALLWTICNEYSGTQIERMVSLIIDSTFKVPAERKALMGVLAEYMELWLKLSRKPYWFMKSKMPMQSREILRYCMVCVGGNRGNFLSSMYLVVKLLFLLNVIVQFFLLSAFLEFNFWGYGPQALKNIQATRLNQVYFPVAGLCHFQLRGDGTWVQCLLSINMLLEKIFLVEWFWLLLLLIVTVISYALWLFRVLHTKKSVKFVERYLSLLEDKGDLHEKGKKNMEAFVMDYLGNDGIFVLRILATNTNDVAMSELMSCIWQRFVKYENKHDLETTHDEEDKPSSEAKRSSLSKEKAVDIELTPLNDKDAV